MKINKKRIRWGKVLLVFLLAFGVAAGLLKNNESSTIAYEGDYWTVTDQDGLSITIESVAQNGLTLGPQHDGEDGFYFDTVDSTSSVMVDLRVDGMQPGETYYYRATIDSWDMEELTSEDNGQLISQEVRPYLNTSSGQYSASVEIKKSNNEVVWKELVFRPAKIASQNIEVISVKQNNVDLALTNNEYQITDYNAPVRITYKLKNLEIGSNYSGFVGGYDHYSFEADATEKTETRDLRLNYVKEHINSNISLSWGEWWENNEYLQLYFKVADENFSSLGDIIIYEIEQGGSPLNDPVETISDGQRKYTFRVNDAQGLTVGVRTTEATDDMNYYISYNMSRMSSGEQVTATGEELKHGVALTIPAAFGRSDESPFTLDFSVNTLGANAYTYGQQMIVYKDYGENQSRSDVLELDVYEDEDVPRYGASMRYTEGDGVPEIDGDRIDPRYVDLEHPLVVRVEGEKYNDEQEYNVRAMVSDVYGSEVKFDQVFTVTGAELNSGKEIALEGLTLSPPEFDADDSSSWYEVLYSFSLEIDGLRQSGSMYCGYNGWVESLLTFDGGEVAAMTDSSSLFPSMYVNTKGMTVRKTTLGDAKNATLQYLGGGFDEDLDFEYAVYYNNDASDPYSSVELGERIDEGTVSGGDLNHDGLSVLTRVPDEESDAVFYSLVITRNNKIVRAMRDYISFTDAPKIESFKFSADSDSFMQTDRTAYRVARDTDITATLTGSGFDAETEYKLWVTYDGARFGEEVDEWGHNVTEDVDLSDLDDSVIVTGAQLNAGYEYVLAYDEAFNEVVYVDVGFAVSDLDVDEPDWYGNEEGSYAGHGIHIDYVNDDEVFRDNGYQVNEDGTITNVSQPDDPHGPDGPIPVDNRATGYATVTVEGSTLTVVSEKPVVIVGLRNGEWVKLYEWDVVVNGDERTNHYSIGDCSEVVVALKGNLKDDDTTINMLDATVIYRSLLSPDSDAYRALTPVEAILADLDGNQNINMLDATVIYRSLLSPDSPAYEEIQW